MMHEIPYYTVRDHDLIVSASDILKYRDTHVLVTTRRYYGAERVFIALVQSKKDHTIVTVVHTYPYFRSEKYSFSSNTKVCLSPKNKADREEEIKFYETYLHSTKK